MVQYGMDIIGVLLLGIFLGNIKVYTYKKQLVDKGKPEYQTAEFILGKPYYIVSEERYVEKFL